MKDLRDRFASEIHKTVVGQDSAIDALLVATVVGGHVLFEGVPGTAKTLLANSAARALGMRFGRIQFTPDMLPSDLTGTVTLTRGELAFRPGPVFTNVLLADEINRTPPKTQSALLEAMQEGQVTVDGVSHELPAPFLVVATQNPIEYEGTYPLPEAQLDRFLMKVNLEYPTEPEEVELLGMSRSGLESATLAGVETITTADEIIGLRALVDATHVEPAILHYVASVVRQTRSLPSVELGASPRAGVHLLAASKAFARLAGRDFVTPDDVGRAAGPVLRHRLLLRPEAELDRYTNDEAVAAALTAVPVPR